MKVRDTWQPSVISLFWVVYTARSVIYQWSVRFSYSRPDSYQGFCSQRLRLPLPTCVSLRTVVCFGSHFSGASCVTCLVHYFSGQCVNSLYVCIGPGNSALFTILIKKENEKVTHWPSSWHPPDPSFQWATNENEVVLLIKKKKKIRSWWVK